MFSYDSVLEKIDENVEFMVAHIAKVVFLPVFAL